MVKRDFPKSSGKTKHMKALIFNGAPESKSNATSERIVTYLQQQLEAKGIEPLVFRVSGSGVPLFDTSISEVPESVIQMNEIFREADIHIWLTPLYHGSLTGAMKNSLDWLEYSAKLPKPYLTGKIVGLACWADGVQAMQGINAMDAIVKALRAWTLPYSLPIQRAELFAETGEMSEKYDQRFQILTDLLIQGMN